MELSKDQAVQEIPNFCFPDINTIKPLTDYSRYAFIPHMIGTGLVAIIHMVYVMCASIPMLMVYVICSCMYVRMYQL